jgi:hypothetical protein
MGFGSPFPCFSRYYIYEFYSFSILIPAGAPEAPCYFHYSFYDRATLARKPNLLYWF